MTECGDLVGGKDSSATPCSQHKPTAMKLRTCPWLDKHGQHKKNQLCKIQTAFPRPPPAPAFIAEVNSTNFSSIAYSHLHFSTIYSKFCISILCMSSRSSNTCLLLKLSLHLPTHTVLSLPAISVTSQQWPYLLFLQSAARLLAL